MFRYFSRPSGARELPARLTYEEARAILEAHRRGAEAELAAHPDTKPEMLYYLAERGDQRARRAVAANPESPSAANRLLADDLDDEVRAELARKIGRLLPGLLASERELVCEQTLETLDRLAKDQLPRVRAILSEEIRHLDCVPHDVIIRLARDLDESVSVPILEYSPLLSDNDLIEIIATARAHTALATIARRRNLNERVSDEIVASLDIPAIAALLANPNAKVRAETMDKLIENASSMSSWHEPLIMRADLSLRAIRRIAGFVGAALVERLMRRTALDEETAAHLRHCLKVRLEKDDSGDNAQANMQAQIHNAFHKGQLDEAYVEALIEAGQRDRLMEALALLSDAPRPIVEKIFASRSAKAITALFWHCKLSMRIAFKAQMLIVKLQTRELLPARAGVAFPMTEDEMRWHLSYFGFAEATPVPMRTV